MGRPDMELGYRGVAGPIVCTSTLSRENNDVQQNTYALDEYGFRVTPGTNKNGEGLVFFGGSNMVGELVNDNETLPYYVSESLGHRYNAVNLGWSGWGPHQMLRLLETGIVKEVVKGPLRGAVLKTAIWHTQRVLGYSSWDQRGPKYQRQDNEILTYMGPFKSERRINFETMLKQSRLIQWVFQRTETITSHDIELYIDVIVQSSVLLNEQYGVSLTILFWPSPSRPALYGGYSPDMVIQRLKEEGLTVLEAADVLNYKDPEMMIAGDGHPTPLAYKHEAQLVSSFFLGHSDDE